MGGIARAAGLATALVCAGCGSFGSAPDPPGAKVEEPAPDAPRESEDRPPAETTSAPMDEGSTQVPVTPSKPSTPALPADVPVFEDEFDRPTDEFSDGWSGYTGLDLSIANGVFVARTSGSSA